MSTLTPASTRQQKHALRRELRAARRGITGGAARSAARLMTRRMQRLGAWQRARVVALFMPSDGEIDTRTLRQAAWAAGKTVCLPVIRPPTGQGGRRALLERGELVFRVLQPGTPLRAGALGIPEPIRGASATIPLNRVDLLVMPLVGFDPAGHRLGMGAGFYDRTLAGRGRFRSPWRVGIAHAVQQVAALPVDPWDQPLQACVTDRKIWTW